MHGIMLNKWELFLRALLISEHGAWRVDMAVAFMREIIDAKTAETFKAVEAHYQAKS